MRSRVTRQLILARKRPLADVTDVWTQAEVYPSVTLEQVRPSELLVADVAARRPQPVARVRQSVTAQVLGARERLVAVVAPVQQQETRVRGARDGERVDGGGVAPQVVGARERGHAVWAPAHPHTATRARSEGAVLRRDWGCGRPP